MRDPFDGSRYSFGYCIGGEPTGDETPLYDELHQCTACGWLTLDALTGGLCLDCVDECAAAPVATVYTLTTPSRLAA